MNQFEQIESTEFITDFSVISNFSILQAALSENDVLCQLIAALQKKPKHIKKVLDRLIHILDSEYNPQYLHPYEISITAYLYVLSRTDIALALIAADRILGMENLWWAKRLATAIQESGQTVVTHPTDSSCG